MFKIMLSLSLVLLSSLAFAQGELCGNGGTVCSRGEYCLVGAGNCLPACLDSNGSVISNASCDPSSGAGCADGWYCTIDGQCIMPRVSDACAAVPEGACGDGNTPCAANERCLAQFSLCMPVCLEASGQPQSIGTCNPSDVASCYTAGWLCTKQGFCVTPPMSSACGN